MIAGALDRRATLQRPTVTQGAAGQVVETWATVASVWASRRDARGREYFEAASRQAELETLFTIRFRSDVLPSWRLICDGQTFDIRGVVQIGRRDGLELRCTAFVPERD